MKIIRYRDPEGRIHCAAEQPGGERLRLEGDIYGGLRPTQEPARIRYLLAPVVPTTIWCIGKNFRAHAAEAGMDEPTVPVVFAKGVNSIQHPDAPILLPAAAPNEVDYECELVVIIGRPCKDATRDSALEYVLGYTCGNDVSARDWQLTTGGGQWCRGKTFDTFAPIGPCLVTKDEIPDPGALRIQTVLNGQVMQDSSTRNMIFDVPTLIEFLSAGTTLAPGTAIFTGTPDGVGFARKPPRYLKNGDRCSIVIEGIGTLTNPVIGVS
ncbi:MAG TPA: fumarylacetoacetate hydrolase family protein [Terriglobales bacterium]|nr:fumarylacetoacetate hydrolase family protein [Terriglobales bacterium]